MQGALLPLHRTRIPLFRDDQKLFSYRFISLYKSLPFAFLGRIVLSMLVPLGRQLGLRFTHIHIPPPLRFNSMFIVEGLILKELGLCFL